jgi:predicted anti-sigma-YlaC factor YlaD
MNCRKVSRWLSAYIDGDLWPTQVTRMDEHLRNCAACREKLVDIRMVVQISGDLDKLEPGPFFTNRVLCTVGTQKQKAGLLYGWRPKLALSAASFVVAAMVTFMNMSSSLTTIPIADNQAGTTGSMVKASVLPGGNAGAQHGFPVSDDVLRRDMALVESVKSDSQSIGTVKLPNRFIQQVDQSR